MNGYEYQLFGDQIRRRPAGISKSSATTLTVNSPPVFTYRLPANQMADCGDQR